MNDIQYSDEYADYIMEFGNCAEYVICNGDTLLQAMEDGYLLDEFINYRGNLWLEKQSQSI